MNNSLVTFNRILLSQIGIPKGIFRAALVGLFALFYANAEVSAQCQTCCNGSKPKSLVLLYNGKSCAESVTCQAADKWSCSGSGPGNAATVYITASKNDDGTGGTYFAGTVNLNAEFTAIAASGGSTTFPSNTYFRVLSSQGGTLLQTVKIHTSCSTPLVAGDQLGSFKLNKITLEDNTVCNAPAPPPPPPTCPTPVFTINNNSSTNAGPVCKNTQIIYKATDLGFPCFVYSWNFGANATPSTATGIGPHTVTYSSTGTATVTLSTTNNCAGGVGSTLCPPPPPPPVGSDCCDSNSGKPKTLAIRYTGQSCSTTNTTQGTDKYSCADVGSGPNGASSVYIIANEKADGSGITYFAGTVNLNSTFNATSPSSTLPTNTFFIVKASQSGAVLQNIKIHTSCSAPIVPGESFGALLLESATWSTGVTCDVNSGSGGGSGSGGPDCCDSNSGKPKSLTIQYNGESCSETSTSQGPDKYSCANVGNGPNGATSVYILANEKADGTGISYFAGTVSLGSSFTATSPSSSLPTNTYFIVKASQSGAVLQNVKIHTSCSAPIVSGDQFGSLVLQAATWASGVTCGQVTPPGPDCIDCQKTTTVTITVQDCTCINQGGDSDGDGVCNNQDCAPFDPNFPKPAGTTCNDNNPNTTNDVIQSDGCSCAGTPACNLSATFTVPNGCLTNTFFLFADANDPYSPPNNPNYTYSYVIQPANTVASAFTIDPRSLSVTFNATGLKTVTATITNPAIPNCQIVKTATFTVSDCSPCVNQGGDSDGDGVCNNVDCQPNNPAFPATPGTPCNDGNPNTNNDVVTANGCGCAGTPTSTCNVTVNGCVITITGLNATSSAKIFNSTWNILFDCNPWGGTPCGSNITYTVPSNGTYWVQACGSTTSYTVSNCTTNPCANLGGDSDGDGVCNNNDCQPNNPAFPATPGSPCNDGNPNTTNDVVTANGCGCAGTPVSVCDNITNGGTIGFGNSCASTASIACNTAAPNIINCLSPSGGSGTIDIIWLKSTTSCSPPTTTAAQVIAGLDPHWVLIPGQTGLTLNPGVVSANTCYLRCTRRVGCANYIESNIISLTTDCNTGTPNCANITISAGNGTITVGNLGAAPFASVKIFNTSWGTVFSCFANCNGSTVTVNVGAGTYYVYAGYVASNYSLICERNQTVTVTTTTNPCATQGGDTDGDGVCNNQDCAPSDPAFPKPAGTPCNDGNPNTTNDVIQANGCTCAGTTVSPCSTQGGDSDGDGVCNNQDCAPFDANFPKPAGTACNDGNPNTTNDVIQANGCTCAGTTVSPCSTQGGDSDGDGVCNNQDCAPFDANFPKPAGTTCNDGNANTVSDVIQADGCTCAGTVLPPANCNVQTNGCVTVVLKGITTNANGSKTYEFKITHNCSHALSYAAFQLPSGYTATDRQNGGTYNGWSVNYLVENPTNNPFYSIKFETIGQGISNGQMETFTYTLPAGAPVLNPLKVQVKASTTTYLVSMNTTNCSSGGGGGTPNCANINISTSPGKINVTGLDGAPISSLQVFNSSWTTTIFSCFNNCGASQQITVPAGSYQVLAKYYNSSWTPVCEKSQSVNVSSALQGDQQENLHFVANKHEEHTTLFWLHNRGNIVADYNLERSSDGVQFERIANLVSLGGERSEYYETYDFEPLSGDNYYRLQLVNIDGSITYSDIQKVNFPDLVDFVLFPNPANGFVKANLETVIGAEGVSITIFNNLGLQVKHIELDEVWSKYYQMDIRDMHEGHYTVWLNVPSKRPIAKKLVVGKL